MISVREHRFGHVVGRPTKRLQANRVCLRCYKNRKNGKIVAAPMEILQVQRIIVHLLHRMTVEGAGPNLKFHDYDNVADHEHNNRH